MNINTDVLASPYLLRSPMEDNKIMLVELTSSNIFDFSDYKAVLELCSTPQTISFLRSHYPSNLIDAMIDNRLIVDAKSCWDIYDVEYAEIETSTYCNWRCNYCPVSVMPKKPKSMPMNLFKKIIDRIVSAKTIKYVTLNSYNEPTIDKYFLERIFYIAKTDLKINLHTNGSGLDKEKLDVLKNTNVLRNLVFNIPSLDENEFKRMTKYQDFDHIIEVIDYALRINLPVTFSVQGTTEELQRNLSALNKKYETIAGKILPWGTTDRAGTLTNEYSKQINIKGKLYSGCRLIIKWVHISVDGYFFTCCEDYKQENIYGHIDDGDIYTIVNSDAAITLRKKIYGEMESSDSFICRRCNNMNNYRLLSIYSDIILKNQQEV